VSLSELFDFGLKLAFVTPEFGIKLGRNTGNPVSGDEDFQHSFSLVEGNNNKSQREFLEVWY